MVQWKEADVEGLRDGIWLCNNCVESGKEEARNIASDKRLGKDFIYICLYKLCTILQ